jgi:Leucine-rich repeat (LRR) protein
LQKLEANAFEMVPQLVSLDLTNCNIKKIAAKAFAHLNNLEKLYLSNNT